MLALGRALMSKNDFFLIDEMSLGLAPVIVQQIFGVVQQINREGISVLLVEQNVPATLRIANRAYVLESGRIVRHDEAKTLLDDPYVRETYLGIEQKTA
jgi:branched-chain amino acid transport system ATP-binding protein